MTDTNDVVIVGATPAGIVAAVRAAREGQRVLLVSYYTHIGGVLDNGYASEDNLTAEVPVDLLLVAVGKEARQTGRQPADTTPATAPGWQAMAHLLSEADNHTRYKQRGAIIEPLFAQLFTRFGRNLTLRGDQVDTELPRV